MSVYDNLVLGRDANRNKRPSPKLDDLFEMFPILGERRSQFAGTLSGGEQQMLAVARALFGAPKVLILDEPTSGLAPKIVKDLVDNLRSLSGAGLSILLVEQNLDVVLSAATRLYVMQGGKIVFNTETNSDHESMREQLGDYYL
jgi:branched-chain amino acid transport system ATP-binding protein